MTSTAITETEKAAFVADYFHLVGPLARNLKRRLPHCFELEDLIAAGNLGLVLAASSYIAPDVIVVSVAAQKASWARLKIIGSMLDEVRGERWRYATLRVSLARVPQFAFSSSGNCD
jgi:DNA-directed RNA polymerase specialized sigma subunit